jgi:hypothetical protein
MYEVLIKIKQVYYWNVYRNYLNITIITIICFTQISRKIFEHFALQVVLSNWVHKTRIHSIKDGATLSPKQADLLSFWRSCSTPFEYWIKYSLSGSTHILNYIKMSVRWNRLLRNQISVCQHVFYYTNYTEYWSSPKRVLLGLGGNL